MSSQIKAEIIQDSVNAKGNRLTTFILEFPRIILSEINTHRSMSRSSSSSRAVKFETMLKRVQEEPFIPIAFQKDHKGMQGNEYFEGADHDRCVEDWLKARDSAVAAAQGFQLEVTKQIRNRLLEPFMMHRAILSGTEFENFFALRAHKDAEIHFQDLAYKMLDAYNESEPKKLRAGQWHIPFGDNIDSIRLEKVVDKKMKERGIESLITNQQYWDLLEKTKVEIAVARCARVSYLNFEGKDDYWADIQLCNKLFGSVPKHCSPLEHCAMALDNDEFIGNFRGFKQYRKFIADENLSDPRVIKSLTLTV